MASFKRYEPRASNASYRFRAGSATFGEKFTETFSAVGLVVPRSESLTSQGFCAVGASETFTMPRVIAIRYTPLGDHLVTFDTLGSELVFVAFGTVDIVFLGDKGLGSNWIMTSTTNKAFFVPLPGLVLHFLHACPENIATSVTSGCELSIVAWSTVDPIGLGPKLLVNK